MASKKRRSYTSAYRREAARLVIDTGRPIAHVAREIGVGEQLLGRWVALARARVDSPPPALDLDERAELERLRTEVADLLRADLVDQALTMAFVLRGQLPAQVLALSLPPARPMAHPGEAMSWMSYLSPSRRLAGSGSATRTASSLHDPRSPCALRQTTRPRECRAPAVNTFSALPSDSAMQRRRHRKGSMPWCRSPSSHTAPSG